MSCFKYTITNNSDRNTAVINYNRCSDNQTISNFSVEPNQTIVIWVVDDTFYTVESNTLSVTMLFYITTPHKIERLKPYTVGIIIRNIL